MSGFENRFGRALLRHAGIARELFRRRHELGKPGA
jgi:hypothetical protein